MASLFDRIKKVFIAESPETAPAAPEVEEPPPEMTPAARLEALGDADEAPDPSYAIQLIEQMRAGGQTARAIALGRRLGSRHPSQALALRIAELLVERGDDAGAAETLAPLVVAPDAPLTATMLAAEIAERRGEHERALVLYQRVLASDLDFPRARERVARLTKDTGPRNDLAGATIATDGALTRGRYRVERELGRGGAGTVFVASDLRVGRRVALKVYHRRGRVERERLLVEVRVPAAIEHPGVVRIFDLDESLSAIAMEWVDGGSVRAVLGGGPLERSRARRWLSTAAEAVEFVHRAGIVHRDLKPSNFLLRADDRVVLTDFGLAVTAGDTPPGRAGAGEGTLQYMPPEQRRNAPAAPASDVFAFGASMRDILAVTTNPPLAWSELSAACMRADPSARPSMSELRESFR